MQFETQDTQIASLEKFKLCHFKEKNTHGGVSKTDLNWRIWTEEFKLVEK